MFNIIRGAGLVALAAMGLSSVAHSANIVCKDETKNYMTVSDAYVTTCVNAGVGNIGNGQNDDFLNGGGTAAGYVDVGDGTYTGTNTGTFSFDASLWDTYDSLAIGFKFGTGNTADEWFIYQLVSRVSSGDYLFTCTLCNGNGTGGLSHISLYSYDGGDDTDVPEPGSLALLGLGLLGLGLSRRRKA